MPVRPLLGYISLPARCGPIFPPSGTRCWPAPVIGLPGCSLTTTRRLGFGGRMLMKPVQMIPRPFWFLLGMVFLSVGLAHHVWGQECPIVGFGEPGDVLVTCNPDDTATVTLRARVLNPTDNFVCAQIFCGPGALSGGSSGTTCIGPGAPGVPDTSEELFPAVCNYPIPSAPQPFVRLTDLGGVELQGCSPVPLALDPLSQCGDVCPTIESLNLGLPTCNDVDAAAGLWPVTADAIINRVHPD